MSPAVRDPQVIEIRCVVCNQQWDVDAEPTQCVCPDDGRWQIRVDGGPWSPGYSEAAR